MVPVALLPETFGPVILSRRAKKLRKEDPSTEVWAQIDFEKSTWRDLFVTFLGRPFRMVATEPLVTCSCAFMSFIYGKLLNLPTRHQHERMQIFYGMRMAHSKKLTPPPGVYYLLLIAYPQIFPPVYNFTLGQSGLAFLPIGIGAIFACGIYLYWDAILRKAKAQGKPWGNSEEFRRLPLACIGGPFFTGAMFWLGWSAQPGIHWIVPALAGLPLGVGFLLLFMSLLNYIVDAYEIYAASALAAAACTRSIFGVVLPFATTPMYEKLGIHWACSVLGLFSVGFSVIPFLFLRYGDRIRAKSKFCQELAEKRRIEEEREARRRRRKERRRQSEREATADVEKGV